MLLLSIESIIKLRRLPNVERRDADEIKLERKDLSLPLLLFTEFTLDSLLIERELVALHLKFFLLFIPLFLIY